MKKWCGKCGKFTRHYKTDICKICHPGFNIRKSFKEVADFHYEMMFAGEQPPSQ